LGSKKLSSKTQQVDQTAQKSRVIACLVQGMTVSETSTETGVSRRAIYDWRQDDEDFQRMLEDADERAYNALVDASVEVIKTRINDLGAKALRNVNEALDSDDERVRLQASQMVFRIGNFMERDVNVHLGLEQHLAALGNGSPSSGD